MVTCILHNCNTEMTSFRLSRKYVTCCAACSKVNNLNRSVIRRGKIAGKSYYNCDKPGCNRVGIDRGNGETSCPKCLGSKMGPKSGRRDSSHYDPVGRGVGGIYHTDFRKTICKSWGKQCDNYPRCSSSCETNDLFEYQTNGGVDCYVEPLPEKRGTMGASFAVHSDNS